MNVIASRAGLLSVSAAAAAFGSLYYSAKRPNKDLEPSLGFTALSIGEAYVTSLQTGPF